MPLIHNQLKSKKERFKIELDSNVSQEIQNYMTWAGIDNLNFFIEEAATFVFSKDKDWKSYKKESKKISA